MNRAAPCEPGEAAVRLANAEEFIAAAAELDPHASPRATITLLAHAAIAASDAICCRILGRSARGEDHQQATTLLTTVAPDGRALAAALRTVLALKHPAGYGSKPLAAADVTRARRKTEQLLIAARRLV